MLESNWPMLQYDPGRTGHAPEIDGFSSRSETVTLKQSDNNLNIDYGVSPIIVDGVLYSILGGDKIEAYEIKCDRLKWVYESSSNKKIKGTPAYSDGKIYFNTGNVLIALDAETGEKLWKTKEIVLGNSPIIVDDKLYISGQSVLEFDKETGEKLWNHKLNVLPRNLSYSNNSIYLSYGQKLTSVSTKTKKTEWTKNMGNKLVDLIPVSNNRVFPVTKDGVLYSLDTKTGSQKWNFKMENTLNGVYWCPAVTQSSVYVHDILTLYALDWSGNEKWRYDLGPTFNYPTVIGDEVYASNANNGIVALNKETGKPTWFSDNTGVISSFCFSDGFMAFSDTRMQVSGKPKNSLFAVMDGMEARK